jgi:Immunity protein 53
LLADPLSFLAHLHWSLCDGDYEHTFGPSISTLDNPGWEVKLELERSEIEGIAAGRRHIQRSQSDWVDAQWGPKLLRVYCGLHNLHEALVALRDVATCELQRQLSQEFHVLSGVASSPAVGSVERLRFVRPERDLFLLVAELPEVPLGAIPPVLVYTFSDLASAVTAIETGETAARPLLIYQIPWWLGFTERVTESPPGATVKGCRVFYDQWNGQYLGPSGERPASAEGNFGAWGLRTLSDLAKQPDYAKGAIDWWPK